MKKSGNERREELEERRRAGERRRLCGPTDTAFCRKKKGSSKSNDLVNFQARQGREGGPAHPVDDQREGTKEGKGLRPIKDETL